MTYSIVAVDRDAGEIGIAVQTRWPGVGATVPWVEAGVGAVATQSFTNLDLGPMGLALMRAGKPPPVALGELVAGDHGREVRQVGLVDANGRSAAHTGIRCVAEAGHVCEPGVSVQGNMLERAEAWLVMLDAFRGATGDLADRLLAALRAGERSGGDIRGCQSAALLVAPGAPGAQPWVRRFDVRVDDAADPLGELARLLRVARAYEALRVAVQALDAGDVQAALVSTSAAHELAPEDAQVTFRHAMVLLANGETSEAQPVLEAALRAEPRLAEFGHRFADAGHGRPIAPALRSVRRAATSPNGSPAGEAAEPEPDRG